MGGKSSKVARTLPKTKPSWAGASTESPVQLARPMNAASETRNEVINSDAMDPQFMRKLTSLGPVKVDHNMRTIRTDARMKDMIKFRDLSELQASSSTSTRNRVLAGNLYDLFEARKRVASHDELARLAGRHDVDVGILERLSLTFNSPSIAEGSVRKVVSDDGEERVTMQATWLDPPLDRPEAQKPSRSHS